MIQKLLLELFDILNASFIDMPKRLATSIREKSVFFRMLIILFATSLIARILLVLRYMEVESEGDSYEHFLMSLGWIYSPLDNFDFLINVWAKPLFTFVSGIVLKLTIENIITIKLINTFIWIIVLYFIYLIAKEHKLNKEIIFFSIFFTSFSFLALRYSIGALTEPLFTLIVVSAYYFLLREQFALSSLLISLSFLCRAEGIIFITIWGVYFLIIKKYKLLIILPLFPLLWDFIGFLSTGDLLYVVSKGYPLLSIYGKGDFSYYITGFLKYDAIIFLFFVMSFFLYRKDFTFIKICILSLFAFNIITWKYGLLGSAGYLRYFLPMIPFMSLLASASLVKITGIINKKNINILFILYIIIMVLQISHTMALINGNGIAYNAFDSPWINKEVINSGIFIRSLDLNKTLYAEDPAIIYFSGRIPGVSAPKSLGQPLGDVGDFYFAYDEFFSKNWGNKKLDFYLRDNSYNLLKNFSGYVYLFEHMSSPQIAVSPQQHIMVEGTPGKGWHGIEVWDGTPTRWMQSNATFLVNSPENRSATLSLNAQSFYRNRTLVISKGGASIAEVTVPMSFVNVSVPIQLSKGANTVILHASEGCDIPFDKTELNNHDSRCLSMAVQNLNVVLV